VHYEDSQHVFDFELDSLYKLASNALINTVRDYIKGLGGTPEKLQYLSIKWISQKQSRQIRFGFMKEVNNGNSKGISKTDKCNTG
jgi:hypothetical protein